MALRPRTRQDALLAGWFLLLLGQVWSCTVSEDNREICLQPKDEGPCYVKIPVWYYDRYTQTCKEFFYGGCGGNDNLFGTEEKCEQTCNKIKRVPEECLLEVNRGTCRAFESVYFFNLEKMTCEIFRYGGCEGNANRFPNKIACLEFCLPEENNRAICLQPKDRGPCRAKFARWYYNQDSQSCDVLIYGGCRGNDNNFLSREECELTCHQTESTPERRALSGKREDQPYAYDP